MATVPSYCVPRRCGICRFVLDDGELFVVVRDGKVVSRELSFRRWVDEEDIRCSECRNGCPHQFSEPAVGCHPECLGFVPPESLSAFIEATSYRYQPQTIEDKRRIRWLQNTWSSILCETYHLPLELCDYIAQYCLRPFAVLRALASWENVRATSRISFSTKVWARYTLFEGVRYISSVTNEQASETDTGAKLVFDPGSGPNDTTILVGEDHLGVRELLVLPSSKNRTVRERPNIWWRSVTVPRSDPELESQVDGIKLRSLTRGEESPQILWRLPQQSTKVMHLFPLKIRYPFKAIRMSAFECNDPAITGYSVYHSFGIRAIHAHRRGEGADCYKIEPVMFGVWQYMPIDEDESLVEIWAHYDGYIPIPSLMFKTDKGRMRFMGAWPLDHRSGWTLLAQPSKEPSWICYNARAGHTRVFGLEAPPPTPDGRGPDIPMPLSRCPRECQEPYYYSSAHLDGVSLVTPSLACIGDTSVITGLLLRHSNKHTSSVGQVRLDSLGPPFKVRPSDRLYLGLLETNMGGHCVVIAATSRPSDTRSIVWLDLPWHGLLEWWFSYRQCKIHHGNKSSPDTCTVTPALYQKWLMQKRGQP
ncbi:hypothetical protein VTH06DRAFT_2295 [Thermothelomyces fergusii]